jgi:hypothetical protein
MLEDGVKTLDFFPKGKRSLSMILANESKLLDNQSKELSETIHAKHETTYIAQKSLLMSMESGCKE